MYLVWFNMVVDLFPARSTYLVEVALYGHHTGSDLEVVEIVVLCLVKHLLCTSIALCHVQCLTYLVLPFFEIFVLVCRVTLHNLFQYLGYRVAGVDLHVVQWLRELLVWPERPLRLHSCLFQIFYIKANILYVKFV